MSENDVIQFDGETDLQPSSPPPASRKVPFIVSGAKIIAPSTIKDKFGRYGEAEAEYESERGRLVFNLNVADPETGEEVPGFDETTVFIDVPDQSYMNPAALSRAQRLLMNHLAVLEVEVSSDLRFLTSDLNGKIVMLETGKERTGGDGKRKVSVFWNKHPKWVY